MNISFSQCSEALNYAISNKKYGLFHSTINNPKPDIHTHECCEIFLCIKGGRSFLIDGKLYDANDGDLFFMNQYEAHKVIFKPGCEVERYVLHVHPEFMLNFSTESTILSSCFFQKNKACKLKLDSESFTFFRTTLAELEKEHSFADDVIKECLIILLLAKINTLSSAGESGTVINTDKSLLSAISFINEHYTEPITLEDVAKSSLLSVSKLCRLFKSDLGTTVARYITSKRISEAKKLLRSGLCVSDAAYECGFNDYANFIRVFSAHVGISPGKYSKSFKKH